MASADYLFRISMDASGAMASAKQFSQQLQKDLGNIKVKPISLDVAGKSLGGYTQAAGRVGMDAGALMAKNMQASVGRFQSTAAQAQMTLGTPLMGALNTAIERPTQASIRAVDSLSSRLKVFDQEAAKAGFTAGGWQRAKRFDQTMGALQVAQRQVWGIRGMGAQMGMYGSQMMGAGVGALGGAGMAAKEYGEFVAPLGRAARNLELNDKLTKELDASLRQLAGTASVFDPTKQAEGLYLWAAATGEVVDSSAQLDTLLGRVGEVQKLASLGMVSYGTAVASVTDIQSQFQLNVTDTESIVATLVKVAATSKAEVGDLADAFRYAGTYAKQTNSTFTETAAIFQLLSAFGQRGSMAGRGMARLMEGLIAPSKQAKKALDEVFQEAFGRTDVLVNAEGKFIGMANTVRTLAEATEDLTEAERANFVATITTQNAARVLLPLLSAEIESRKYGISAIEENIKILSDQSDAHTNTYVKMMKDLYGYTVSTKSATQTLRDQWSQFLDSTDGRLKKSQASMQSAIVSIGASVMQFALPAMEKLADIMRDIADYSETHPGAVEAVLKGAVLVMTIGALVKALGVGLTLYADSKAIGMALTFKTSMDQFGVEVATFVAGVHEMSASQAYMMGGPASKGASQAYMMGGAAPAAKGGTRAITAGSVGGALVSAVGWAVVIAGTVAVLGELVTRLSTGRGILDLMSTDAEALAAGMQAAADAAQIIAQETSPEKKKQRIDAQIEELEKEQKQWAYWIELAKKVELMGKGRMTPTGEDQVTLQRWERAHKQIPKEYKTAYGNVVGQLSLLKQGYAEVSAEIEEFKVVQWDLWVAAGQGDIRRADEILQLRQLTIEYEKLAQAHREMTMPTAADLWGTRYAPSPEKPEPGIQESGAQMAALLKQQGLPLFAEWTVALGHMRYAKLYELAEVLGIDAEAMDEFILSMSGVEGQMNRTFGTTIQNAITLLREFGQVIPSEQELAGQLGSAAQGEWSTLQGLQGIGWDSSQIIAYYQEYLSYMEAAYSEAAELGRWEGELHVLAAQEAWDEIVSGHFDAHEEMKKQTQKSIDDQAAAYKKASSTLRGVVEGALKPTQVTAADMAATEAGVYEDKWDEEARRMRAAMAGSAKWEHMIPEDIRAQGGEAAKKWGQNWINEFYAGMHPDAIRWDPLLDSIEQALALAAGKKNLVDTVIKKLWEERGIKATSEQVLAAAGVAGIIPVDSLAPAVASGVAAATPEAMQAQASELVDSVLGPVTQEFATADMTEPAQNILMSLDRSIKDKSGTIAWTQIIEDSVKANLAGNKGQLVNAGMLIGNALWEGVFQSFESANIVHVIVRQVLLRLGAEE